MKFLRIVISGVLVPLVAAACATITPAGEPAVRGYDLLIAGGTVFDGRGTAGVQADVAIRGDRIVAVSTAPLDRSRATRVIDARGSYVTPGFIDVHAHLEPIMSIPSAESHVRQGVTTAIGGPDGRSPWPLGDHMLRLEELGIGMNVGYTVGHNTVREWVVGLEDRRPSEAELTRMEELVAIGMREGAFGISTGLKYIPGAFAEVDEVIALSRVVAEAGGFYTSHLRDEGLELMDAVAETIEIGERAGLPVVISHHKVVGRPMWGSSVRSLAMVDSARARGVDVRIDQYPYTATHTGLSILVPEWAQAGGQTELVRRLDDPVLHDSIFQGIVFNLRMDRGGGDLRRVQFSAVSWDRSLDGATLHDWAVREGLEPTLENGARLVVEAMRRGGARSVFHALDEEDVRRIMRHPQTMIASDGRLVVPGDGHPHPRWYGTFPRVLGHYVRDQGVLGWEEAIHRMTGLPATLLGLTDRGVIAEGAHADLVVFDPATVRDRATFQDPHQYPEGISHVILNGSVTVDGDAFHDTRAGRILRHPVSRN